MRGVFSLTALVLAVPAFAADRYVDDGGSDTGECTTAGSPCGTISYALSKATAGDTVHVASGSYSTGDLSFKGSINIEGAGSATPQSLLVNGGSVFHFESASGAVSIKGFAIQHSSGNAFDFFPENNPATISLSDIDATLTGIASYAGVYFKADKAESLTLDISNATFNDYQTGVLGNALYATALDLTLTNTTISAGMDGVWLYASGNTGDVVTEQPDLSVHIDTSKMDGTSGSAVQMLGGTLSGLDLVLSGNTFSATNTSYDAVHVHLNDIRADAIGATIVGNTFKTGTAAGEGLQLSAYPAASFDATVVMNDNTFEAGASGVYLYVPDVDQGTLTFNGNTLQNNGGNGATLYMSGNDASDSALELTCQGNTATDNGYDGIYFSISSFGVATMVFTGNTLEDNGDDGLQVDYSGTGEAARTELTLAGNTIGGNGGDGIDVELEDYGEGMARMEGNTVSDNGYVQAYLYLNNASDTPGFLDLQVNNNTIQGSDGGEGILIWLYDYNTVLGSVSGNTVTGVTDDPGLSFWVSDTQNLVDLTLFNNTLTENYDGLGIKIHDSENALHFDVVGNTITDNSNDGVWISEYNGANNLIVGLRSNDISDNGGNGVIIDDNSGAFTGLLYGNLIRGNEGNGVCVYSASEDPFGLELTHNTISGNGDGYTNSGYYDVNAGGLYGYDVLAWENWWGTLDTGLIDDHIYDWDDDSTNGVVFYSALGSSLNFDLAAPSGPAAGGTQVLIRATDDLTRFVPPVPGHPLVVSFGGEPATDLSITNGGQWLWATIPAHAPGSVIVAVTNPGGQSGTNSFEYVAPFLDADADGVEDSVDNCLGLANPEQGDPDNDGMGNACDPDDDGDGEPDATDNCPLQVNADQSDLDGDDIGDACDPDADGDEVADFEDNCLGIANAGQEDMDADDIGDACDPDANGDGVADVDQIAEEEEEGGCGCATTPAPATGWLLVGLLGLTRRRRGLRDGA